MIYKGYKLVREVSYRIIPIKDAERRGTLTASTIANAQLEIRQTNRYFKWLDKELLK